MMNGVNLKSAYMETDVSTINSRIAAAYSMREIVKSEWGKNYWDSVLAYLLRQANRLN